MFSLGCGRLFECSATQMWDSLNLISQLPDETLIYCTHEYTLANGKFAQHVDPNNIHLKKFLEEVRFSIMNGRPSIPVILKDEVLRKSFHAHPFEFDSYYLAMESFFGYFSFL